MWAKDSKLDRQFPMVETFDLLIELLKAFRRETMRAQRPPEDAVFEERRRRDGAANPAVTVPARMRDGDVCRWCGVVVAWRTRKSPHSGTYAHLRQEAPVSEASIVVACMRCTTAYRDGTLLAGLRPAPAIPYFSDESVGWLLSSQWRQEQGLTVPAPVVPQRQPGTYVPVGWSPVVGTTFGSADARATSKAVADEINAATRRQARRAVSLDAGAAEPLTSPRARLIAERDAARVELAETQAELRAAEGEVDRLRRTLASAREIATMFAGLDPADADGSDAVATPGVEGDR